MTTGLITAPPRDCDSCKQPLIPLPGYGTYDNALTLEFSGGYGAFTDLMTLIVMLCHDCGHKLVAVFGIPQEAITNWHQLVEGHPLCKGWVFPEKENIYDYGQDNNND